MVHSAIVWVCYGPGVRPSVCLSIRRHARALCFDDWTYKGRNGLFESLGFLVSKTDLIVSIRYVSHP
jgi:hypothetical protein